MSKAIAVMFSVVHHILLSDQFHLATGRLASANDFTVTAISFQQLFTKQSGNIHFFLVICVTLKTCVTGPNLHVNK